LSSSNTSTIKRSSSERSSSKRRPRKRRNKARGESGRSNNRDKAPPQRRSRNPAEKDAGESARWGGNEQRQKPVAELEASSSDSSTFPNAADPTSIGKGEALWGDDSHAPTPEVSLEADLPADVPASDPDPATYALSDEKMPTASPSFGTRICNVVGVRFVPAGRLFRYDSGDECLQVGDRVVVESDQGSRVGVVGVGSTRTSPGRSLKRILRRARPSDVEPDREEECQKYLAAAKALAKERTLRIKIFLARMDEAGKVKLYYSCEHKTDVRSLSLALSKSLGVRVDMRHAGGRDEAKLIGGIGSCGQELCCTTWLPAFVPVSIRHAKDQGLVINPTKVSGQCGRLKCCLVYEQALYAEMRKGLPKLGKRVITEDGFEGRVVEVDVLHQRIRVAVGRGESKIYSKDGIKPMFPSQPQRKANASNTTNSNKKKRNRSRQETGEKATLNKVKVNKDANDEEN